MRTARAAAPRRQAVVLAAREGDPRARRHRRTNHEIAARLFLTESTVKSHLASAFEKLGVRSRKDAAALLLDPEEGLQQTALPQPGPPVLNGR